MTDANSQAPGAAPPAGDQSEQAAGSAGEKVLGFVGAGIGLVLLGIGIDLITGGALSRAFGLGEVRDDTAEQPG